MLDDVVGSVEVYPREDGKWEWRARARNGEIIATSGSQGYENRTDCLDMASKLFPAGNVTVVEEDE